MKAFCLPPAVAQKLLDAVKNGEWSIRSITEMSSEARRDLFSKYVDVATAVRINAGFENAMIDKQVGTMEKWAKNVLVGKEVTESKKKDIYDKIRKLNEHGFIKVVENDKGELKSDEAGEIYLNDLVEEALGVTITVEEMTRMAELLGKLDETVGQEDEFGLPTDAYWQVRRELDDFVKEITPAPKLRVLTSTIGRGAMLASIKSPFLNIWSNTVMLKINQLGDAASRVLLGQATRGTAETNDYAKKYSKRAVYIMSKYGYDVTRIFDLRSDVKQLGEQNRIHSKGKGTIRKIGRLYEDLVFSKLLSLPDVYFSSLSFSHSANLWSQEFAKRSKDGLSAIDIFKDATRIEPRTKEGNLVRKYAVADAQHVTFTDDTWYSKTALNLRGVMNEATGDIRAGDLIMPFVKTPANVIGAGFNMAGVGTVSSVFDTLSIIKGSKSLVEAVQLLKSEKDVSPRRIQQIVKNVVMGGLGMVLVMALIAGFDPDDFIGAYPTNQKERDLMNLQNAMPNSIRIGSKWISIDYFGPLAQPLLGTLYARKYKGNFVGKAFEYFRGNKASLGNFPGVEELSGVFASLTDQEETDVKKIQKDFLATLINSARARIIPGIITDFAKISDEWERDTNSKEDILGPLKASLPGVRKTLEIKDTVMGDQIKTERDLSILLLGSRFKTAQQSRLIDEIVRLKGEGVIPTISDVEKTSTRFQDMKGWIGQKKYSEMVKLYQRTWVENANEVMNDGIMMSNVFVEYKSASPDLQAEMLNKARSQAMEYALKEYDYEIIKREKESK